MQQDDELAARWEEAVRQAILSLRKLPGRGVLCHFRAAELESMRWISIQGFSQHKIFYRYLRREAVIRIIHVLHGARDAESIFSDPAPLE